MGRYGRQRTQPDRDSLQLDITNYADRRSEVFPNFRLLNRAPTAGLNLLPEIRVIPNFNKFFKWIPESAAKMLIHVPNDAILIGVDELTAIVKRSGSAH